MFLQNNKCKRNDYLHLQWIASKFCFYMYFIFPLMAKYTKKSQSGRLYSIDNFFYKIVVSTVKLPISKHTKCKDLAVANKNQTTGTLFLEDVRTHLIA